MEDDSSTVRRTSGYLSRFECARLLGLRVLQLQEGEGSVDPWQQAKDEIRNGENPAVIRRFLPDGSFEDVKASELKISRQMRQFQVAEAAAPE